MIIAIFMYKISFTMQFMNFRFYFIASYHAPDRQNYIKWNGTRSSKNHMPESKIVRNSCQLFIPTDQILTKFHITELTSILRNMLLYNSKSWFSCWRLLTMICCIIKDKKSSPFKMQLICIRNRKLTPNH